MKFVAKVMLHKYSNNMHGFDHSTFVQLYVHKPHKSINITETATQDIYMTVDFNQIFFKTYCEEN